MFSIFLSKKNLMFTEAGVRKWHRKKGKLLIRRSRRRTFINRWLPKNSRRRLMLFNVQDANKCVLPFSVTLPLSP